MGRTALLFGLLAAVAAGPGARAAVVTFRARLSAANEVPPVKSSGRGRAAVNADSKTREISWRVNYSGTTGPLTAASIDCGAGPAGNAQVTMPLGRRANLETPITGSGRMTAAQFAELAAGRCYVNLETAGNRQGELRGQLRK